MKLLRIAAGRVAAKALLTLAVAALSAGGAAADVVLDWNRVASDVLAANESLQNPGAASRSMAMMNLAIYDALAMTKPGGTMFYDYGSGHDSPALTASDKAAAAQAAYTVLSSIYGDQQTLLDAGLTQSLSHLPNNAAKQHGLDLGTMIGQSIIDRRANDGWMGGTSQYQPTNEVGHWQPDPLHPGQQAWGPDWGDVQLFSLGSNAQFMPPPMPDLTSQEYADAYNEVKDLGAVDSPSRTAEQTEIGNFWAYDRLGMGTPMRLFNDVLQTVAVQEGNTVKENAELFAKATVAMADAGVVAWNSKFEHDFWRPVTGIRQGDLDGNDLTEGDEDWTPLGAPGDNGDNFTPPFPTYLSGHATFGGALFGSLIEFYDEDGITFTVGSEELPGIERTFDSFTEAMAENGRSRVYLGIHWNFDDTLGQQAGMAIAQNIMSRPFVSAVPEPATLLLALLTLASLTGKRRR
ncbi:PAP2 superfamily protein [Pseudobythopirellula maris]|uniref:PAP2 superfamily protein n=1 Tax=Pseudobythopirellula maris TaxID=2527991 RepID=A0A5C5ZSD1_9BACT|nr:vanadium-dependent haloperoxidase [Pseudobythopirellula maris]TWT90409.1 PAP2 superfamily protein [Pseudobythopirellula maris]